MPSEPLQKKDKAIANGFSLPISPKQSKAICRMIRRKTPDRALIMLEDVTKKKRSVQMTSSEVGHQKGKGVSGGAYPVIASSHILGLVKQLKANCSLLGIEEPVITIAMPNQAPAPLRRGGRKSKRTHIHLEAREISKSKDKKV